MPLRICYQSVNSREGLGLWKNKHLLAVEVEGRFTSQCREIEYIHLIVGIVGAIRFDETRGAVDGKIGGSIGQSLIPVVVCVA